MRDYELVIIVSPAVEDDAVSATVDRVQEFIAQQGGQVKEMAPWGRRKLAYPIDGFKEGNYVVAQLGLDPQSVRALEDHLKLTENVIRHLVVKLEDEEEEEEEEEEDEKAEEEVGEPDAPEAPPPLAERS
ncbi:MAG: 30S ribosomal protein S6 [Dehalococcoidia bacterium]